MLTNRTSYRKNNLRDVVKTFNDGVVEIYAANERILGQYKGKFRYATESVGIAHFFQAYENNISIDTSISIPYNNITIDSQDIVKLGNDFYKIARIQYHDTAQPRYWTLSLSRSVFQYEVLDEQV